MTSKAEQLIELATDYQDKEEYSKAIKTYTEAISIINSEINNINDSYDYQELNELLNAKAYINEELSLCSLNTKDFYDAIKYADLVINSYHDLNTHDYTLSYRPNLGINYYFKGEAYISLKQYSQALAAFQEMLDIDNDTTLYNECIIKLYIACEEYNKAIEICQKVMEEDGDSTSFTIYSYLIECLCKTKNYKKARELYNKVARDCTDMLSLEWYRDFLKEYSFLEPTVMEVQNNIYDNKKFKPILSLNELVHAIDWYNHLSKEYLENNHTPNII